jgi:hypothetical protein
MVQQFQSLQPNMTGARRELSFAQADDSIVEIKRIRGPIFSSREAAEEHGLKLCKDWIDKQP